MERGTWDMVDGHGTYGMDTDMVGMGHGTWDMDLGHGHMDMDAWACHAYRRIGIGVCAVLRGRACGGGVGGPGR
eukprot:5856298-Prymnesium_polylepis.1